MYAVEHLVEEYRVSLADAEARAEKLASMGRLLDAIEGLAAPAP
ncbi:hypothetical protein [Hyperthermus butylicus]|nr:hypothetical protein [Hyperthermus butylicus]